MLIKEDYVTVEELHERLALRVCCWADGRHFLVLVTRKECIRDGVLTAVEVGGLKRTEVPSVQMSRCLAGGLKLHRDPLCFYEGEQPLEGTVAVQGICVQTHNLQVRHLLKSSLGNCGQMVVG